MKEREDPRISKLKPATPGNNTLYIFSLTLSQKPYLHNNCKYM